jgi:hypothetical protein
MRKLFALLAAFGLCLTATACGSNACEDAVDKTLACVKAVDCSSAGAGAAICEASKKQMEAVANAYGGEECSGQNQAWADEVNKCTLDPTNGCQCKQ